MLKLIAACLIACTFTVTHAQSDFIVLKKRHTTIQNYMPGDFITILLVNDNWLGGYIKKIQNDSIYVRTFSIRVYVDSWGLHSTDTAWGSIEKISMANIKGVPKQHEGFAYIKNGQLLEIGAGGYILLNVINTLGHKDPLFSQQNASRLGTAGAVLAAGIILNLTYSDHTMLGKKYHLDYIKLNASSH